MRFWVHGSLLFATLILLAWPSSGGAQAADPTLHDFGTLDLDAPMEHTFVLQNQSQEPLLIKNVQLTPPLVVTRMPARVEPGGAGNVTVQLKQPRMRGEYKGSITVNFKNEGVAPAVFWAVGELVAAIEFSPMAAFYVTAQRGQEATESIEISSHEADPMEVMKVLHSSSRFNANVETIEPGRRFRLTLRLKPDAPAGRATDEITLVTSSRAHPFLKVQANTTVNERVYAFPSEIDFETISVAGLKARTQAASSLTQSITVYQVGGTDFHILSAASDVPFLQLMARQGALKDRSGVEIRIIPEKLKQGAVSGSIIVTTNDPNIPTLSIPVKALVDANW